MKGYSKIVFKRLDRNQALNLVILLYYIFFSLLLNRKRRQITRIAQASQMAV